MNWFELLMDIAFRGFWHFIGVTILLGIPLNFIINLVRVLAKSHNIRKHGYPPAHCDAEGDYPTEDEESDEE